MSDRQAGGTAQDPCRDGHDWKLWVPMGDGTERERRQCRNCALLQTKRGTL